SPRDDPSTEMPPLGPATTVNVPPDAGTVYSRASQNPCRSLHQFWSAHQSPLPAFRCALGDAASITSAAATKPIRPMYGHLAITTPLATWSSSDRKSVV